MMQNSLLKIEQELNIELPDIYKEIFLNNPFRNKQDYDKVNTCILNDVQDILDININIRSNGYQSKKWPDHYYIFGYYRKGGYLFINTKSKNPGIIFLITSEDNFNLPNIRNIKHSDNFEKLIKILKMVQKVK